MYLTLKIWILKEFKFLKIKKHNIKINNHV